LENHLVWLIDLQRIDSELDRLNSLRGDLPQQVVRLKDTMEEARKKQTENHDKVVMYQKEKGMAELEIKALEGKQQKYQTQLYQVKNNREYDAVTTEIENVKLDTGKKESRFLELMDLEKEAAANIEHLKADLEKYTHLYEEKNRELAAALAKTEKEELVLKNHRQNLVVRMKPAILSAYVRIRNAKDGLAVVAIIRNACGGCYKSLPPQRMLEIRQMNRIICCDVCGRILIWTEKDAGSVS